jgi:hypothetical protein
MPLNISGSVINSSIARTLNYKSIVTRGIIFQADAGAPDSYPETGTTANSLVGGYSGTLVNGVGYSTSNGGTWTFDGTNDYIEFTGTDAILNGLSSATLSFWTNVTRSNTFDQLAGWRTGGGGMEFFILLLDGGGATVNTEARVTTTGGGPWDINVPFQSYFGSWVNIAFVVSSNRTDLYFNGSNVGSNTNKTGTFNSSVGPLYLGGYAATFPSQANIANVIAYNRALAAAEITQNFNAQRGRFGI